MALRSFSTGSTVFYNSVGARADAAIQLWLNETQEGEHG